MTAAKLYRRAQVKATEPDAELESDDYEGRALRALWTHRWLDNPMQRFEAQLKGGGSAWPNFVRERQGDEVAKEPRPRLRPCDVTDHDKVMPWFNGLAKRDFNILWLRGALGWEYQRIGDKWGRTRQWAHMRCKHAMQAVVAEAARGSFEI